MRLRPALPAVAGIAGISIAVRLVYGTGSLNTDAAIALAWGRDLVFHGRLPNYELGTPTPRPLATLVSACLSPLGDRVAPQAVLLLTLIAFATVVWLVFRLGEGAFSWPVGALAALLVATSPSFLSRTLAAFHDLPFTALVLGAALLELRRPRRGAPVMVLLAIAGLIRPEA